MGLYAEVGNMTVVRDFHTINFNRSTQMSTDTHQPLCVQQESLLKTQGRVDVERFRPQQKNSCFYAHLALLFSENIHRYLEVKNESEMFDYLELGQLNYRVTLENSTKIYRDSKKASIPELTHVGTR